jgi:hypothetical protein
MTDQPDHRAEAEKWLQFAGTLQQGGGYIETATYALIGIGHALLAFTDDGGWEGLPPGTDEPDSHWRNVPISEPPTKGRP